MTDNLKPCPKCGKALVEKYAWATWESRSPHQWAASLTCHRCMLAVSIAPCAETAEMAQLLVAANWNYRPLEGGPR